MLQKVNERKHNEKVISADNVRKKYFFVTTKLPEKLKGTETENLTSEALVLSN